LSLSAGRVATTPVRGKDHEESADYAPDLAGPAGQIPWQLEPEERPIEQSQGMGSPGARKVGGPGREEGLSLAGKRPGQRIGGETSWGDWEGGKWGREKPGGKPRILQYHPWGRE